jgi:hypothetical protein
MTLLIVAFYPPLTRAENEMAKLLAAPSPRSGIPLVCFLNVAFEVRSELYFRKAVSFDTLLNPYAIVVTAF